MPRRTARRSCSPRTRSGRSNAPPIASRSCATARSCSRERSTICVPARRSSRRRSNPRSRRSPFRRARRPRRPRPRPQLGRFVSRRRLGRGNAVVEYVEMLRARRALIWYGSILFACVALGLALAFKDGSPRIQMSHGQNPMIPFQYLLAGSAIGPLILAAFLAVGLDAEYKTIAITWTRPISRLSIALRYLAVDGEVAQR